MFFFVFAYTYMHISFRTSSYWLRFTALVVSVLW